MLYDNGSFNRNEGNAWIYNSTTDKEIISYNTYVTNILTPTVHGIFTILGLTFNIVTILVIVRGRRFAKRVKIQLANLAVADLISSLFIPTASVNIEFVTISFPNNAALCKIMKVVRSIVFYASLLCNTSIALERFVAVYFPFRMVNYTKRKVVLVNVLVWIVASVSQTDVAFITHIYPNPVKPNKFVCFMDFYTDLAVKIAPYMGIKLVIPAVVIFVVYLCIAVKLRMRPSVGNTTQSGTTAVNNKVMVMLAVDGIFAVLIWTPYYVFMTLYMFEFIKPDNSSLISEILFYVILTNTFITPIIYFIFNKDYRADMSEILCLSFCKKRRDSQTLMAPSTPSNNLSPPDSKETKTSYCNSIGDENISNLSDQQANSIDKSENLPMIPVVDTTSSVV